MFAVPENTVLSTARVAPSQPTKILREVAADRCHWVHLVRYHPDKCWTALVGRAAEYEIWLMSWLPGQGVAPHDHGSAEGAFTVVTGELTELVGRRRGRTPQVVRAGQSRVFGPNYAHQVSNCGTGPAVSVHVIGATRMPCPADGIRRRVPAG